jgi:hypothetical protein
MPSSVAFRSFSLHIYIVGSSSPPQIRMPPPTSSIVAAPRTYSVHTTDYARSTGSCDVHRRVLRTSSPSNRATGLLLCRLVRPQHRRPCQLRRCIYIVVPCASMIVLRNLCHAMCLHKVFVIEPPLPAPSLSPARWLPLASPLSLLTDPPAPALLLLRPAQPRH